MSRRTAYILGGFGINVLAAAIFVGLALAGVKSELMAMVFVALLCAVSFSVSLLAERYDSKSSDQPPAQDRGR